MTLNRCVCFNQTFAKLKEIAQSNGCDTLEALQGHIPFGENCGLCRPYVRRMLQTGETVFREVIKEPVDRLSKNRIDSAP